MTKQIKMEVNYEIIRPNLYVLDNIIYIGMEPSELMVTSHSVDKIIQNHIGELKAKKCDLEIIEQRKEDKSQENIDDGTYTKPLRSYLAALEKRHKRENNTDFRISNEYASLFEVYYLIESQTLENNEDIKIWKKLENNLKDPELLFKNIEKSTRVIRIDRDNTLKQMKNLKDELEKKLPDNCADFLVIEGYSPYDGNSHQKNYVGVIGLGQIKAKGDTQIKKAKTELIKCLTDIRGPNLSLETPNIVRQMLYLLDDAHLLVQDYGDILNNPLHSTRLFKLTP